MANAIIVPGGYKASTYQIRGLTSGGGGLALAWTADAEDGTNQTTYTFSSVAIGVADANRIVAVGVWYRSDSDSELINSMTIGGVSATQVSGARSTRSDGALAISDIWYASVPTGTTATIVIVLGGGGPARLGISTYRIITTTPTPTGATFGIGVAETSTSGTLTIPSGGAGFAMYGSRMTIGTGTTWTNATKDYDVEIPVNAATVSSAKITATNAITAVGNSGGGGSSVSCAAWGP